MGVKNKRKNVILGYCNKKLDKIFNIWYSVDRQEESSQIVVAATSKSFPRKIKIVHINNTRKWLICQRGLVLFEEGGRAHEVLC